MLVAALLSLMAAQSLNPDAVAIVGQSLANGSTSTAVTTSQVGNTTVFSTNLSSATKNCGAAGAVNSTGTTELAPSDVVPLVENTGLNTEKPRAGMAAYFYNATGRSLTPIQAACGGGSYAQMKKGQGAFTWLEYLLEAYGARTTSERVIASVAIHGEQDRNLGTSTATYKANLLEWQADIEAKVLGVTETGANASVPMLINQTSSSCTGAPSTLIVAAQWQVFRDNPTRVILVQPTYPLVHNADDVHLVTASYQTMGAQFGKVVTALRNGQAWRPLYPTSITLSGSTVRACFNVPYPPLVLDTTLVAAATNYGFAYNCSSSPPAITDVALFGPDCVDITLASTPSEACQSSDVLRYAWPTSACTDPGPILGSRGNLRDSDPATHAGTALYNWLVQFEEAVP